MSLLSATMIGVVMEVKYYSHTFQFCGAGPGSLFLKTYLVYLQNTKHTKKLM